jgi:predicted NACHT family NTPase
LIELALWLQQHRPSGTATRHDLLEQLTTFYLRDDYGIAPAQATGKQRREAAGRAESVLCDMRQYSGLLIERGQNAFGFRHLTFQEYFAGRALARMEDKERWQLVQPNLHSNRWREP